MIPIIDDAWNYKNIDDFYNRVRMALNAVSETTLPDNYIDFPEKAPFAEMTIKSRVPNWKELSEEKFKIFESLIVYQTAVLFQSIVSSKYVKKKQIPTITLEYSEKVNFDINDMSLQDLIESLLGMLIEDYSSTFIGFKVTSGNVNFH